MSITQQRLLDLEEGSWSASAHPYFPPHRQISLHTWRCINYQVSYLHSPLPESHQALGLNELSGQVDSSASHLPCQGHLSLLLLILLCSSFAVNPRGPLIIHLFLIHGLRQLDHFLSVSKDLSLPVLFCQLKSALLVHGLSSTFAPVTACRREHFHPSPSIMQALPSLPSLLPHFQERKSYLSDWSKF